MKKCKTLCYKGTNILVGNSKREALDFSISLLKSKNFMEIQIPIIQLESTFENKVGQENNNLMYTFKDRGNRELCLAPEYTSVIQELAQKDFKDKKDIKLFYVAECFRGEKPQKGRYRQFTQLGVEVLNPSEFNSVELTSIALKLCSRLNPGLSYELHHGVTRGLDYYTDSKGFEIKVEELGSSKQVCGGGPYEGGLGFAIGVDRILNY
jgi:histidyl-tRNA synthetase